MRYQMNKKVFSILAAIFVVVAVFGATPAQAAPAKLASVPVKNLPGISANKSCSVDAQDEEICYDLVEPQFTDPTYECPKGSTPIEGDSKHCRVDDSQYVYADRPVIPATYKCPDGFEAFQGGDKPCRQVDVAGHYITAPQPIVDYTCQTVTWSYTDVVVNHLPHGVTTTTTTVYSITFVYDKSSDPTKCHRPSDDALGSLGSPIPFSEWPGNVNGEFRSHVAEFIDATAVYGDCSLLGAGWETDPAADHQCRKWIDTTYNYADLVVDVAAHYGLCSSLGDGWEQDPDNEGQCRKWVTGGHDIDAIVIAGVPYCADDGELVDGKCKVVVECPPTPPVCQYNPNLLASDPKCKPPKQYLNCKELQARYTELGRDYQLPKSCVLPKTGGTNPFLNLWAQIVSWFPFLAN